MLNDLRYAARTFMKNPGFTIIALVTLAIGIGANTAIFSVVHGVLLRPLPFVESDRLVTVWTATPNEPRNSHSAGEFREIQRENRTFIAIAGYRSAPATAVPPAGHPLPFEGVYATIDFFDVLATPAAEGRTFAREVDGGARDQLVVLSHDARRQLFGERDAIGQRLRVNGASHLVIGVMPPQVAWPETAKLWMLSPGDVPTSPMADRPEDPDVRYFNAIARLRPGVSLAQAHDDTDRLSRLLQERRTPAETIRVQLAPIHDAVVRDVRYALLILQAAVGVVLLIACANVSSLLIARASGRRREFAIRAALGAGRARLVRQLLAESLLLGLAGGLVGLLVGAWLTALLVRLLPAGVPRAQGIQMDVVVMLVTLVTALAAGLLFGVLPALHASRSDTAAALKTGDSRTGTGRGRARAVLVVAEIALTLVLLAAAGLLVNSFLRLQRVDSGFQPDRVVVAGLAVPPARYPTGARQTAVYRQLVEALAGRPEIEAAGVGFPGPLRGDNASSSFSIDGRADMPDDRPFANLASVSGGFFRAMGVPILGGRTFTGADRAGAPGVVIVSETLAKRYWPGADPIGKRLRLADEANVRWMTVVGVCGDARQLGLHAPPPAVLYIPFEQFPLPFTTVAVRSGAPVETIVRVIRTELQRIDPELGAGRIATLNAVLDRSVAEPRFRTFVLAVFAAIALVLAAVGVYGLVGYSVTQRTREIGIRVALGAQPRQVLGRMMREGLLLAAAGVAIGLAGAALAGRALSRFLFQIETTDVPTFAAVAALLVAVALMASYVPSRRALSVDPVTALRNE